ncbi:MAG TPA: DedA family protein [Geminicoccus sp.]|jgi:membrane protein DedA with SNARE-associated domain|uniref:DedA family protein n=1 Tax=Geminicoccus sp. TaxID=2024832 RepID=UPI002E345B95|nr:DedA family protein [Geminicoccus sp.]HEX2528910.1 DedA family protein [Geminicoccus sp.]
MFDWITQLVQQTGYAGIAFLMLLENVFPPIPSELIMPLAGFSASRGQLNIVGVIAAGTFGSVLGALFWYYVGKWVGVERLKAWAGEHGRWFTISPDEVDQANGWFERHAGLAVLIGRLVPAVRSLISVPAGIANMSLPAFLAYSTLGTGAWAGLLAGAGYLLGGQYEKVEAWLNPVSNVIFAAIVLLYIYRVVTFRPQKAR